MAVLAAVSVAVSGSGEDLFHLDFSGTAQALVNGTLTSHRITQWDLIARCAGEQGLRTNNLGTNQQFDLAYNPAADSIQVVSLADGSAVCDVFQFQGGITNDDGAKKARIAYVFAPEETQSVGTVILRERDRNPRNRLSLHGQIQFVLASLDVGSEGTLTNSTNSTNGVVSSSNAVSAAAVSITAAPPSLPGLPGSGTTTTVDTNNSAVTGTNSSSTATSTNSSVPPDLALPGSATVVSTNSTLPPVATTNTPVATNPSLTLPPDLGLALSTATNTSLPNLATTNGVGLGLSTTNAVTNAVSGLSFTNGVICNATFSASRRIRVIAAP
jgi:hypothetical protein